MGSRVAIFGIDGGTLSLVERWRDELPNLHRFMEGGAYGLMESSTPALTNPAWACMFTGKNPGKLGMYGWISSNFDGKPPRVFSSEDFHEWTLWKILSEQGKTAGLLNVPMTYPPHEINGYMICGLGTPEALGVKYMYPYSLKDELDRIVGGYEVLPNVLLTLRGQEEKCLNSTYKVLNKRISAAKYLIKRYPCDLFVCVFSASDVIQHYFWGKGGKYRDVVKNIYKRIDTALGILSEDFDNVLVVSDHGFRDCAGLFNVNGWLALNGFLSFKNECKDEGNRFLFNMRDAIVSRLSPETVRWFAKYLPRRLTNKLKTSGESQDKAVALYHNIDWEKTKAYAIGTLTGGIYLRDKAVKGELLGKLRNALGPDEQPLGLRIIDKEQAFWGAYAEDAPDLSIELGSSKYYPSAFGDMWSGCANIGSHAKDGLFMAYGTSVTPQKLEALKIYDVFPTVLGLMGLQVPDDIDGRTIEL